MMRVTFTVATLAFLCCAAAATPPVTFESPCECHDNHGKHRWSVKIDPSLPPTDANAIQSVTPSDIYSWRGPDAFSSLVVNRFCLRRGSNMKYWQIVADKLSAAGWSWGYCSAVTKDGWRWIVDAHREGRRYILQSDELLTAFLELESTLL